MRSLGLNLLLSAASLGVGLGGIEVALRLLEGGAKGGKEQRERNRYTEHDPLLGWRKTPGARASYDRRDFRVEFRVNSRGLRGPERAYEKPAGTARVLALGDSFVEAFVVPDEQTVAARLEARLRERGCRAEVVNGGTVGYSTDQEYLFYREEGRRYAPDVVVLFVYHNDIPWLVLPDYLGYAKPVLDFETRPPRVVNLPVPDRRPPQLPVAREAPSGSRLLDLLGTTVEGLSARRYQDLARLGLWAPLTRMPMNEELKLYQVPELGHLRPAWSAFTWTLQALSEAVAADGARLVVAYVPSRMEVDPRVWERTQVRYGLDASFERGAVASRVGAIAQRLAVPQLDLTAPLGRTASFLSPVYFPNDGHWNARGQDAAAEALAGLLGAPGLLPDCR